MTTPLLPTRPAADTDAGEAFPRALACDAGSLVGGCGGAVDGRSNGAALERARAGGLRVGFVYDRWPSGAEVRAAVERGDVIVVPEVAEMTIGRERELRPAFASRLCAELGVAPPACVVVGGRRSLLAAAAWIGARTVMVPDDATPLFDVRGQRLAPDLRSAVDGVLAERGRR